MLVPTLTSFPVKAEILALCSVAEMKENLRISYTKEDNLIERCILAAYDWLAGENGWLKRSVLTTGWTVQMSAFSTVELPKAAPALAISSFSYLVDGVSTPVPGTAYLLRKSGTTGYATVSLKVGQTWPTDGDLDADSITLVYTAGMGTGAASDVKAKYPGLHKAMALLAGDYFRNREDTFTDIRMVEIDRKIVNGVQRVAGRYRFMNDHG